MNITAVYFHKQTKRILSKIKKSNVIISIFAGRAGDVGKINSRNKKSIKLAKNLKM